MDATTGGATHDQRPAPRLLIVDDHEDNRLVLATALEDEGYELIEAEDGNEALTVVARQPPDVILLDIMMPGLDGIEVTRRLQAHPDTARIPIILVTALSEDHQVIAGLEAGATDYVGKPFSSPVVRARVRAALRTKQALDELDAQNAEIARLARALRRKNERLADLTATAHRFVDNVAHEFRTPLSVIKEFSSIIADELGGPVTPTQREYLEFIEASTRDLAQMVDDFLDSSKLKARTLRVDRQAVTVDDIIERVRPVVAARAGHRRIEVRESIAADTAPIFADPEKASRVVLNLVVNAIKFSPEDGAIDLWTRPAADGGVEIGVTDCGPGLEPGDVAKVFERFRQVGDVERASTRGFGLGLNIAKELIWLNLGTVRVESEIGRGSTFAFTLPPVAPRVILAAYLDRLAELTQRPPGMAVLRADAPADDASAADLRRALVAQCHPTDLVLPIDGDRACVLIGCTTEPRQWIDRLAQTPAAEDIPSLRLDHIGAWPFERAANAVARVIDLLDSGDVNRAAA